MAITLPTPVQNRLTAARASHPDIDCLDSRATTLPLGKPHTPTAVTLYLLVFTLADGSLYAWVLDATGKLHFGSPAGLVGDWWDALP